MNYGEQGVSVLDERKKLIQLIEGLPEEKVTLAMQAIRKVVGSGKSAVNEKPKDALPLQELLTGMVYGLSNSLYDLSADAEKKGDKVLAKRLDVYRKKVAETWDSYKMTLPNEK